MSSIYKAKMDQQRKTQLLKYTKKMKTRRNENFFLFIRMQQKKCSWKGEECDFRNYLLVFLLVKWKR